MRYAIAAMATGPFVFLMWPMLKALGTGGRPLKADADRRECSRRRAYWVFALFFPTVIVAGCIVGAILNPTGDPVTSSFLGDAVGSALVIVTAVPVALYIGHAKRGPKKIAYIQGTLFP